MCARGWLVCGLCGRFDAIRLFDGQSVFQSATNPMAASLCGTLTSALPDPYVLGPSMVAQFVTDSAGTGLGFLGQYEAVTPSTCTRVTAVSESDGTFGVFSSRPAGSTLTSALVPAYAQGANCSWLVQVLQPSNVVRCVRRCEEVWGRQDVQVAWMCVPTSRC